MSGVSVTRRNGPSNFLDLGEASILVGIDPRTLRRRIEEGQLAAFRPGRRFRIRRIDLHKFMMGSLVGAGKVDLDA